MDDVTLEIDKLSVSESMVCDVDDCHKYIAHPADSLTVITQNIRSISANFDNFLTMLNRLKIECDIVVLTECWLSCCPFIPILDGYKTYSTKRLFAQNDGVTAYIKSNLNVIVEEPDCEDSNCLVIKISKQTAIIAAYRSPSYKKIDNFLQSLNGILQDLSLFKNIVITGDINININPNQSSVSQNEYLNVCSFHGLLPAHTLPTRHGRACLDHIILKTKSPAITIVLQTSVTDHQAVLLCLKYKQNRNFAYSTFNKVDKKKLYSELANIDWDPIYRNSANDSMEYVVETIQRVITTNSVVVKLSKKNRIIKTWVTPGLLRCMKHRDNLHKKLRQSPDDVSLKLTYTRYRNHCNKLLKKLKVTYETNLITAAGYNNKKLWEAIKNITNTSKTKSTATYLINTASPKKNVEDVNEFFVSVGRTLAENTIACKNPTHVKDLALQSKMSLKSFVLLDTDEGEVERLILNLKSVCSVGWDSIPNYLLKENRQLLVPVLTYIFNRCLQEGTFPKVLKKSVIIPIYKNGHKNNVTNYRPISILPSLSKILERIINSRIIKYLEANDLLSENQFGFRTGKSTSDAVHELVDHLVRNIDAGKKTVGIFVDLAKAFDTVSIPLLLNKLDRLGIRGNQLKLIEDYLSNRYQCTRIDDIISDDLPVSYGVPQGSVLGPTLFLIYLNDLCDLKLEGGKIISYADDTALIFSANKWEDVYGMAQAGFNTVCHWFKRNMLTLNAEKTVYIPFSIRNYTSSIPSYSLIAHDCCNVDRCHCPSLTLTNVVKYLGIFIDNNLSFKHHVNVITVRMRKLIYLFRNLRNVADPKLIKQVYMALGQSLVGYCITVWGGAPKTTIKQLEIAQRAILKVSTFRSFLFPTYLLYQSCGVLSVRQLFVLLTILKQHSSCIADTTTIASRRRKDITFPSRNAFKHQFTNRYFPFLGPYLYGKISKHIDIRGLNSRELKQKLIVYIHELDYTETEKLLHVPS